MALSFSGAAQTPHFERKGFRISGKRMFATYLPENNTANIFLTPAEQKIFCKMNPAAIYAVQNKWGEKGATTFELGKLTKEIMIEALLSAHTEIMKQSRKKEKK